MMTGGVFLIQDDDQLVEMTEQPYGSEDRLQELLAKYPNLLAGGQINPADPRRWLLVSREVGIPGEGYGSDRWAIDHLFLDQDAIPTLVEVKRSTNPQIRREVVGQMLDYAANGMAYWRMDALRASFEANCEKEGLDPEAKIAALLEGGDTDPEAFWQDVGENLRAGRLRMIFVADEIPAELQRIVEFLNEQMDPAEVLAIEIKQYGADNLRTLVPRVIGQSAKPTPSPSRKWDEASILEELRQRERGADEERIAKKILEWIGEQKLHLYLGRGRAYGALGPLLPHKGVDHRLFYVWTYGRVDVQLGWMASHDESPFHPEDKRRELLRKLNEIPGVVLSEDRIDKYPSVPLAALVEEASLDQFLKTFEWVIEQIRAS
ncbi:MAG TPA: hypothetical protein VMX14_06505 [Anaerolineae bacterium]|nr:hypothetical protein [Anaerolineae bacterium]